MILALVGVVIALVVLEGLRRLLFSMKWDHFPGERSYTSLPLIGHSYLFGATPLERLNEHREKYGDIFRLDAGNFPTVWLCNFEDVSECFKQDIFSARPYHMMPAMVTMFDCGIRSINLIFLFSGDV